MVRGVVVILSILQDNQRLECKIATHTKYSSWISIIFLKIFKTLGGHQTDGGGDSGFDAVSAREKYLEDKMITNTRFFLKT